MQRAMQVPTNTASWAETSRLQHRSTAQQPPTSGTAQIWSPKQILWASGTCIMPIIKTNQTRFMYEKYINLVFSLHKNSYSLHKTFFVDFL